MMEYQAIIKIGRATLKVMFTDGSMTAIGQNPAKYTTSDFLVQHAIENSSDFKRGRITVVNSIELDEEVRIERNPVKASTQQAPAPAEAKPVAAAAKVEEAKGTAEEPSDEANAGEAEAIVPTDTEDTAEDTAEETTTADGKTEVEFSTNQEAKDYLVNTFGVKTTPKTRAEIVAMGETYGVKITFVNEK